ncbi:MAG: phage head-tail connector protein [Christensenellales bacterium]|jgi:hypothetical protein
MLEDIKGLLGLTGDDKDGLLNTIIKITKARLSVLIKADEVPEKLSYIVTEVTIARFNRIGSEGLKTHSVEGESMTWDDNDFAPYMRDIEAFNASQGSPAEGRIKFL